MSLEPKPEITEFLEAIVQICEQHNLGLNLVDNQTGFEVVELERFEKHILLSAGDERGAGRWR